MGERLHFPLCWLLGRFASGQGPMGFLQSTLKKTVPVAVRRLGLATALRLLGVHVGAP